MGAGSYSKDIIDMVDQCIKLFYIKANKSANLLLHIRDITDCKTFEINYKKNEVTSLPIL